MSTKIEWCRNKDGTQGESWNPVTGCTKVSAGCLNCYAERMHNRFRPTVLSYFHRYGHFPDEPISGDVPFNQITLHPERLDKKPHSPLHWRKPQTIFVCSMSDLFHEDVPWAFIYDVMDVIKNCQQHRFIILTKRPDLMADAIYSTRYRYINYPLPNLILGVSVENQHTADERIPWLLKTPAVCRMVSHEPALAPVSFAKWMHPEIEETAHIPSSSIDWFVMGGETGPGARPMNPDWVRSARDQCVAAGVPFWFKQWGEYRPAFKTEGVHPSDVCINPDGTYETADKNYVCFPNESEGEHMRHVGKKAAGNVLDGQTWEQVPEILR